MNGSMDDPPTLADPLLKPAYPVEVSFVFFRGVFLENALQLHSYQPE